MDDRLLDEVKAVKTLVEENNKILRGMRRNAIVGKIWHVFYWAVILGTGIASYYYLQPYIDKLTSAYKNVQQTQQNISNFPDSIKNYFSGNTMPTGN